jgi:hypothetical protein
VKFQVPVEIITALRERARPSDPKLLQSLSLPLLQPMPCRHDPQIVLPDFRVNIRMILLQCGGDMGIHGNGGRRIVQRQAQRRKSLDLRRLMSRPHRSMPKLAATISHSTPS